MKRTQLRLYYLASYLVAAGIGLVLAPDLALEPLFSRGDYADVFPRMVGVLLLGLGIIVIQIIRLRVNQMYTTTLVVRGLFLLSFVWFYVMTRDPFFLSLLVVVGLGFGLTGVSYLRDRAGGGDRLEP